MGLASYGAFRPSFIGLHAWLPQTEYYNRVREQKEDLHIWLDNAGNISGKEMRLLENAELDKYMKTATDGKHRTLFLSIDHKVKMKTVNHIIGLAKKYHVAKIIFEVTAAYKD